MCDCKTVATVGLLLEMATGAGVVWLVLNVNVNEPVVPHTMESGAMPMHLATELIVGTSARTYTHARFF